ncbi:MAG: DUF5777 family beta-barrel protein [Verrucomicrobiaceae bacterium]
MKAVATKIGVILLMISASAQGQGMLSIGQKNDYKENVPLTVNVTAGGGYDHTVYGQQSNGVNNVDSGFIQGGFGLRHASSDHITKTVTGADFSVIQYLDDIRGGQQTYYNARVSFDLEHAFNRRLSMSDNFYMAYEYQPDYTVGITSNSSMGQYLYGYNNFAVSYAWSDRFATTTSYTASGIHYQDSADELNDRFTHVLAQVFTYKRSRTTAVNVEARFEYDNYPQFPGSSSTPSPNYTAFYLLVGVDHGWSPTLTGSLKVGAQYYDSDRIQKTEPYLESALNYAVSRVTNVRWYQQLGFDGSNIGDYDAEYSYRTGIIASQRITEKLTGNAGIHYVHSNYKGNDTNPSTTDNEINASVGMNYKFWKNLSVDANYSYTTIASDIASRDYNRNYTTLGLNASF